MVLITVNGTPLPNPSEYFVSLQDIDSANSERTSTGRLQRDRVRAGVYKIELSWRAITRDQLKLIINAVAPAEVEVEFFDPTRVTMTTATMYAGDRRGGLVHYTEDGGYWSLAFNLIEY